MRTGSGLARNWGVASTLPAASMFDSLVAKAQVAKAKYDV